MTPSQKILVKEFLTFLANVQLYHWITRSHARHEAAGELYDGMSEKIDEFLEVYIGSNGLKKMDGIRLPVSPLKHKEAVRYLKAFQSFLSNLELTPTLANLRDEMSAQVSRALYKFAQH